MLVVVGGLLGGISLCAPIAGVAFYIWRRGHPDGAAYWTRSAKEVEVEDAVLSPRSGGPDRVLRVQPSGMIKNTPWY